MKMRIGFVSNSSSSSFLIGLKNKPKTKTELRTLMFGDMDGEVSIYDLEMSIPEVVERVFSDLRDVKPLTEAEVLKEISNSYFPGYPEDKFSGNASQDLEKEFINLFNASLKPGQKPINSFCDDAAKTHPEYEEFSRKRQALFQVEYEQREIEIQLAARKHFESLKKQFEGLEVYALEYSDNNGESVLEHGGIFEALPHAVLSHH